MGFGRHIVRFRGPVVTQHILLMISVLGLIISGLSLLYPESSVGRAIAYIEGGGNHRGLLHNVSGVILILTGIWHFLYIFFTRDGHNGFRAIFPGSQDLKDYVTMMRYKLGRDFRKPKFERYGYSEKLVYWTTALVCSVMVFTGLIRMFPNLTNSIMPRWITGYTYEIHSHLGLIIIVIFIVWHVYAHVLKPGKFPGSLSWLDGKISEKELREQHYLEWGRWRRE